MRCEDDLSTIRRSLDFLGPQVEVAGAMLPTEEVPDQSTE